MTRTTTNESAALQSEKRVAETQPKRRSSPPTVEDEQQTHGGSDADEATTIRSPKVIEPTIAEKQAETKKRRVRKTSKAALTSIASIDADKSAAFAGEAESHKQPTIDEPPPLPDVSTTAKLATEDVEAGEIQIAVDTTPLEDTNQAAIEAQTTSANAVEQEAAGKETSSEQPIVPKKHRPQQKKAAEVELMPPVFGTADEAKAKLPDDVASSRPPIFEAVAVAEAPTNAADEAASVKKLSAKQKKSTLSGTNPWLDATDFDKPQLSRDMAATAILATEDIEAGEMQIAVDTTPLKDANQAASEPSISTANAVKKEALNAEAHEEQPVVAKKRRAQQKKPPTPQSAAEARAEMIEDVAISRLSVDDIAAVDEVAAEAADANAGPISPKKSRLRRKKETWSDTTLQFDAADIDEPQPPLGVDAALVLATEDDEPRKTPIIVDITPSIDVEQVASEASMSSTTAAGNEAATNEALNERPTVVKKRRPQQQTSATADSMSLISQPADEASIETTDAAAMPRSPTDVAAVDNEAPTSAIDNDTNSTNKKKPRRKKATLSDAQLRLSAAGIDEPQSVIDVDATATLATEDDKIREMLSADATTPTSPSVIKEAASKMSVSSVSAVKDETAKDEARNEPLLKTEKRCLQQETTAAGESMLPVSQSADEVEAEAVDDVAVAQASAGAAVDATSMKRAKKMRTRQKKANSSDATPKSDTAHVANVEGSSEPNQVAIVDEPKLEAHALDEDAEAASFSMHDAKIAQDEMKPLNAHRQAADLDADKIQPPPSDDICLDEFQDVEQKSLVTTSLKKKIASRQKDARAEAHVAIAERIEAHSERDVKTHRPDQPKAQEAANVEVIKVAVEADSQEHVTPTMKPEPARADRAEANLQLDVALGGHKNGHEDAQLMWPTSRRETEQPSSRSSSSVKKPQAAPKIEVVAAAEQKAEISPNVSTSNGEALMRQPIAAVTSLELDENATTSDETQAGGSAEAAASKTTTKRDANREKTLPAAARSVAADSQVDVSATNDASDVVVAEDEALERAETRDVARKKRHRAKSPLVAQTFGEFCAAASDELVYVSVPTGETTSASWSQHQDGSSEIEAQEAQGLKNDAKTPKSSPVKREEAIAVVNLDCALVFRSRHIRSTATILEVTQRDAISRKMKAKTPLLLTAPNDDWKREANVHSASDAEHGNDKRADATALEPFADDPVDCKSPAEATAQDTQSIESQASLPSDAEGHTTQSPPTDKILANIPQTPAQADDQTAALSSPSIGIAASSSPLLTEVEERFALPPQHEDSRASLSPPPPASDGPVSGKQKLQPLAKCTFDCNFETPAASQHTSHSWRHARLFASVACSLQQARVAPHLPLEVEPSQESFSTIVEDAADASKRATLAAAAATVDDETLVSTQLAQTSIEISLAADEDEPMGVEHTNRLCAPMQKMQATFSASSSRCSATFEAPSTAANAFYVGRLPTTPTTIAAALNVARSATSQQVAPAAATVASGMSAENADVELALVAAEIEDTAEFIEGEPQKATLATTIGSLPQQEAQKTSKIEAPLTQMQSDEATAPKASAAATKLPIAVVAVECDFSPKPRRSNATAAAAHRWPLRRCGSGARFVCSSQTRNQTTLEAGDTSDRSTNEKIETSILHENAIVNRVEAAAEHAHTVRSAPTIDAATLTLTAAADRLKSASIEVEQTAIGAKNLPPSSPSAHKIETPPAAAASSLSPSPNSRKQTIASSNEPSAPDAPQANGGDKPDAAAAAGAAAAGAAAAGAAAVVPAADVTAATVSPPSATETIAAEASSAEAKPPLADEQEVAAAAAESARARSRRQPEFKTFKLRKVQRRARTPVKGF